jgi:prevent-host-death family protein
MTIKSIGAAELRVELADVLDQVRFDQQPVAITRFGKTVAYIVHPSIMDALVQKGREER